MSDLQCPATVLVVRHGQSEGNVGRRLSAAVPGGPLTERGREQAAQLARTLLERRVAAVYASPLRRAQETAQVIAEHVGVPRVHTLDGVREFGLGDHEGREDDEAWARVDAVFDAWLDGDLAAAVPGGESGEVVVRRVHDALGELADLHRGETVVVVSHGGAMSLALPRLADNVPDDRARESGVPNCGVVELSVDGDGWRMLSWPPRVPQLGAAQPYPGDLVDLLGRAAVDLAREPAGGGVEGSSYAVVAGVPCWDLPLPSVWAAQAALTGLEDEPSPDVLAEVSAWLEKRSPGSWTLVVREAHAAAVAAATGLGEDLRLGAWVCEEAPDADLPPGAEVAPPREVEEFLSVYGAELRPVAAEYLEDPDRELLVLRVDGVAVGCARLADAAGTTYVGGVTVRPERRGEGWGRLVSALATRRALQRSPLAWLTCEEGLGRLYGPLGYRHVTDHVHLVP